MIINKKSSNYIRLIESINKINSLLKDYSNFTSIGFKKIYHNEDLTDILNFSDGINFYIENKNQFTESQQKNIESKIKEFDFSLFINMLVEKPESWTLKKLV